MQLLLAPPAAKLLGPEAQRAAFAFARGAAHTPGHPLAAPSWVGLGWAGLAQGSLRGFSPSNAGVCGSAGARRPPPCAATRPALPPT